MENTRWYVDFVVQLERDDVQRLRDAGAELPSIAGDKLDGWRAHPAPHTAVVPADCATRAFDHVRAALTEDLARAVREWTVQSATIREMVFDDNEITR